MTALNRKNLAEGFWASYLAPTPTKPIPPIVYTLTYTADSTTWTWDEGDSYDVTWTLTLGGGTQTGVYVEMYWQDDAGFNHNPIDDAAELSGANTGWTVVSITDFGSYYKAILFQASMPVGTYTLTLPFAPLYDGVGDYDAGVHGPTQGHAYSDQQPLGATAADMTITVNAPPPSYTIDASAGIACPANLTEHAAFETAVGSTMGNPDAIYLFDEASGNILDKVNTRNLTVTGGASYLQAVSGWARPGLSLTTGNSMSNAATPNANANSITMIFYAAYSGAITTSGNILLYGTSQVWQIRSTNVPRMQHRSAGNVATGTNDYRGQIRPFVLRANRVAGDGGTYSDLEKVVATYASTPTGASIGIGGCGASQHVWGAVWYSDRTEAQVKAWLLGAGWTIPW